MALSDTHSNSSTPALSLTDTDSDWSPSTLSTDDMDDDEILNEVPLEVYGSDDARTIVTQIETGGAEEIKRTTHLTFIIESSTWNDWEDDCLCTFLNEFVPLSENLQHLSIVIRGNTFFTHHNYIKPLITFSEVITTANKGKDEADKPKINQEPMSDGEDADTPPGKRVKHTRSSTNSNGYTTVNANSPGTNDTPFSNHNLGHGKLKTRVVSPYQVSLHIHEKLFVAELLKLHKPIPLITITGPMEISFRRHIISTLNPEWETSPHCVAHMGKAPADRARVATAEDWEANMPEMKRIGPNGDEAKQDGYDFGLPGKKLEEVNRHGLDVGWVVPTGKAGRAVMGWRAMAGKTWKGPSGY